MQFDDLLRDVEICERTASNPPIRDVVYDSRQAGPGTLFLAMQGGATDGNRFVGNALQQGAIAIVTDSQATWAMLRTTHPGLAIARVSHGRRALSGISANAFSHPERRLHLSGVTGTNGKTTTTYLLESMLRSAGRRTILVGTIETRVAQKIQPSVHTTPESRDLFQLLAEGVTAGVTEAVMEVSSHALDQERVWGLHWDTAVFTNLTQDHLDYHGTMEAYFHAKAKIFTGEGATPPRVAAIHSADAYGERMMAVAHAAGCDVVTYGLDGGDFCATNIQLAANETRFRMKTPVGEIDLQTRMPGPVNVLNLLAASAAAVARGLTLEEIAHGVEAMECVPGRFQPVDCGQPFTVLIDYAHTEDALRNVTKLARQLARPRGGRVLTVFGCGGDRDRTKRPKMGRAAGDGSDFVVATSDNPRTEDPAAILAEIVPGLIKSGVKFAVEEDRSRAIRMAITAACENDVVVVAGKGHEKMQSFRDRTIPFDDAEEARQALIERFGGPTREESDLRCN